MTERPLLSNIDGKVIAYLLGDPANLRVYEFDDGSGTMRGLLFYSSLQRARAVAKHVGGCRITAVSDGLLGYLASIATGDGITGFFLDFSDRKPTPFRSLQELPQLDELVRHANRAKPPGK